MLGLEKIGEPKIKIANFPSITEKVREFQKKKKKSYLCLIDYTKASDCVDHNKLWKALKEIGIPPLEWRLHGAGATVW